MPLKQHVDYKLRYYYTRHAASLLRYNVAPKLPCLPHNVVEDPYRQKDNAQR